MANYPLISGNAQSKFDLSTNSDNDFDIFVSSDSNNIQTAFLVFVLKNTATDSGENLLINSIEGNAAFNEHFTLDFIEDGQSLLHMGPDGQANNVIKAPNAGGLTATATGVTNAQLVSAASLASGIVGHYGLFVSNVGELPWDSTFNAVGSFKIGTFYKTLDIINNPIPPNSYATFIARYKPTTSFSEQDLIDNPMQLTIGNSYNEKVITFNGVSANDLIFAAVVGTATDNPGATDTFTATSGVINDEGEFNLGYHPTGYDWGTDSKTLKFTDISTTPGEYTFEAMGIYTKAFFSYRNVTLDGYGLASNEIGNYFLRERLNESYKHIRGTITEVGSCGTLENEGPNVTITAMEVAPNVYKNFEFRNDSDAPELINIRSSHRNWIGASDAADYEHVTAADITLKTHYYFNAIRNINSPQLTAPGTNNESFVFSVRTGFYNKLTMSEDEKNLHADNKKLPSEIDWNDNSFNTFLTLNQSTEGPYISSTTGPMFRDKMTTLAVYFRYNNFDNNADDAYKINTAGINLQQANDNSIALEHDYLANGTYKFPAYYDTSVTWDNGGQIWGTEIETVATDAALQVFSADAVNANTLALKYNIDVTKFSKGHLYPNYAGVSIGTYTKVDHEPGKEEPYGVISTRITPAFPTNDYTIWAKGLGHHNVSHIAYRLNFLPIQSRLELVDLETANIDGEIINLSLDHTVNNVSQSTTMKNIAVDNFYEEEGTTAISADIQTKLYTAGSGVLSEEGGWYGAAGMTIHKPGAWTGINVRDYDISTVNYTVLHNPVNNLIKNTVNPNDYYNEAGPAANFLFKMEDAVYDTTTSTYKAKGYLGVKNTGDYICYIQTVSIGHRNLKLSHGTYTVGNYMDNAKMLFPEGSTTGEGDTRKPHANSAEPTWTAAYVKSGNPSFGNLTSTYGAQPSAEVSGDKYAGYQHLTSPSDWTGSTNDISTQYMTHSVANPQLASYVRPHKDLTGEYLSHPFFHKIAVEFVLDPTNNASQDQGAYYAQLMVTYFVNDYKNRYEPSVDGSGNITEDLATAGSSSTCESTRLHVSKYLIKCEVTAEGVLQVVDSEDDEAGSTIQLPNMNIG